MFIFNRLSIILFIPILLASCTSQQTPEITGNDPSENNTQSTNTQVVLPTETVTPGPTKTFFPILDIGSVADLGFTDDIIGIFGRFEIISVTEIELTGFTFTAIEAPGVDIQLGIDGNFDDEFAVSLRDVTGVRHENRIFKLTIPSAAFDGRNFNSIAVFCYDTGGGFDYIVFETP